MINREVIDLRPNFIIVNLKKEYRLIRDVLPPNI